MFEPITGVVLPDSEAQLRRVHVPSAAAELELVILPEVYDDPLGQNHIARILDRLLEAGGVGPVAVEGAEGPVARRSGTSEPPGIEHFLAGSSRVSAGVLHVLAAREPAPRVVGVDDEALHAEQTDALVALQTVREAAHRFFSAVEVHLTGLRRRLYPPSLQALDPGLLSHRASGDAPLTESLASLRELAADAGVDLRDFEGLRILLEIAERESLISREEVERQRRALIETVTDGAFGWWTVTGPNLVSLDLERLGPLMCLWLRQTGRSLDDLGAEMSEKGAEQTALDCRRWAESWLVGAAVEARDGRRSGHGYLEDLILLAVGFGVDLAAFRDLRAYVATQRLRAEVDLVSFDQEWRGCWQLVLERLCRDRRQRELLEVDRDAQLLARAYRCALGMEDLGLLRHVGSDEPLSRLVSRLDGLGCDVREIGVEPELDSAFVQVRRYYDSARRRGQHMTAATVEQVRRSGEHRGVLVCGGFHLDVVMNHLVSRYPKVAWSVVQPQVRLPESGDRSAHGAPGTALEPSNGEDRKGLLQWTKRKLLGR